MATYERRTTIRAPLESVWEFHSTVAGLEALTPDWLGLRVEAVIGPDGERRGDPQSVTLEAGTEISLSLQPFGQGPRQHWTSRITERTRGDGIARFRDTMDDGPFEHWEHSHTFAGDDEQTTIIDRVDYRLPFGPLGTLATPFSVVGFEGMFRQRHRETRRVLETGQGNETRGRTRV
ncbi:START domain protein [Natrialba magadii ATCC 43099]|uniref:Cyclase/dehydrase n=1 Tax=Natrialba magadii (strain ATCC 43099 / DSM 3394 / CCM 3739 / CIP 104546 / IAM 13178 / JCM 8861 / NBRC 102185 / NCIMB 2190 / MS3) TaxID=547559 RepID=D3SXG8_NATMM|nr:SRPBCC family protein [Natrialba magadii]ADD05917.1 START domain protein [Natrialba magadii ATCC 43099]ELY30576.1 cyclase/dehydrase [Natrialba magadii ATCC 43099]